MASAATSSSRIAFIARPKELLGQAPDEEERKGHEPEAPPEIGMRGQSLQTQRSVGDALKIVGHHPHHFSESQCDNGQGSPPAPERPGNPMRKARKAVTTPAATRESQNGTEMTLSGQIRGSMMKEICFSAGLIVRSAEV